MVALNQWFKIPEGVVFTLMDQDAILLNTLTGKYYGLDDIGARLWNLIAGGSSAEQACQVLLQEYEVSEEQLSQDILELIDQLVKNDLLAIRPA